MKKLAAVGLAASALFALSGCGGDAPATSEARSTSSAATGAAADGKLAHPLGGLVSSNLSDGASEGTSGRRTGAQKAPEEADDSTSRDLDEVESGLDSPDVTGISAQKASGHEPTVLVSTTLHHTGPNTLPALDQILGDLLQCLTDETRGWLIQVKAATGEIIEQRRLQLGPR